MNTKEKAWRDVVIAEIMPGMIQEYAKWLDRVYPGWSALNRMPNSNTMLVSFAVALDCSLGGWSAADDVLFQNNQAILHYVHMSGEEYIQQHE